jgi:hypothetical protein
LSPLKKQVGYHPPELSGPEKFNAVTLPINENWVTAQLDFFDKRFDRLG